MVNRLRSGADKTVVRCIKHNIQLMKKRVMARAVAQKAFRQLWTEVRKIRSGKSNMTNSMDMKTGSANIAELFSEKIS